MTDNGDNPNNLDLMEQEELVAYLDGELDAARSAIIDRRLAEDPEYRVRLQQLQQAWDLLDELPRPRTAEDFTRSTVEVVVASANAEVDRLAAIPRWRRWLPTLMGTTLLLAAAAGGFLFSWLQVTAEDRHLLRDLPVIEKVDQYRYVPSVEFLRMLQQQDLFSLEASDES